jgi:hypothetical protein
MGSFGHAIALTPDCLNRVCAKFHAQTPDEDFQRIGIPVQVLGVDVVHNLRPADGGACAVQQETAQTLFKPG